MLVAHLTPAAASRRRIQAIAFELFCKLAESDWRNQMMSSVRKLRRLVIEGDMWVKARAIVVSIRPVAPTYRDDGTERSLRKNSGCDFVNAARTPAYNNRALLILLSMFPVKLTRLKLRS